MTLTIAIVSILLLCGAFNQVRDAEQRAREAAELAKIRRDWHEREWEEHRLTLAHLRTVEVRCAMYKAEAIRNQELAKA